MKPVDLNFLLHFDALMRTANVSRAADLIGISQPAMSGALARLRELFGDPLLVRSGNSMVPTQRASELHQQLVPLLEQWRQATEGHGTAFEPQAASRTYTLVATDYIQFLLLPRLAAALAVEAPAIRLTVLPTNPIKTLQLLESNQVEFAIGQYGAPPDALRTRHLYNEAVVCLLRRGHPALRRPWDRSAYAAAAHVRVTSSFGGNFSAVLEQTLQTHAIELKVQMTLSSYLATPYVVARTDLVATTPGSVAHALARSLPVEIVPVPVEVPPISIALYWHERYQADAAHQWLRNRIAAMFVELSGELPAARVAA